MGKIIALADWRVKQIAIAALLCTVLGELFDPFPFDVPEGVPRVILVVAAYFGTGLFTYELTKNRRLTMRHVRDMEREIELRREVEQQMKFFIESSPAAILTLDSKGEVLIANDAAHHLFGFEKDTLHGAVIASYLPALGTVPFRSGDVPVFRTKMECRGQRRDGEVFLANIWFSVYRTMSGPRLAAVVETLPKIFATGRSLVFNSYWTAPAFWWAPFLMRSATSAVPSPSCMRIVHENQYLGKTKISKHSGRWWAH